MVLKIIKTRVFKNSGLKGSVNWSCHAKWPRELQPTNYSVRGIFQSKKTTN